MQTSGVTTNPYYNPARTTTDRGVGTMQSEDFFKLLITELKQQDPFEPAKTSDMINQISQIRGIELSSSLTEALSNLQQQQHTSGASEMLGKFITATLTDAEGNKTELSGIVTGVRFGSEGAVLELDSGQTVLAKDVTRITSPENAAATATGATSATTTTGDAAKTGESTSKAQQTAKTQEQPTFDLFPWLDFSAGIKL